MITSALAQNLVAIGMADMLQRTYMTTTNCIYEPHYGCCQEQLVDVFHVVLEALGASEATLYGE